MKHLSKIIKKYDNYGKRVSLNFRKQGETVNTVSGGVLTIVGKILSTTFLVYLLIQMFNYSNSEFK